MDRLSYRKFTEDLFKKFESNINLIVINLLSYNRYLSEIYHESILIFLCLIA